MIPNRAWVSGRGWGGESLEVKQAGKSCIWEAPSSGSVLNTDGRNSLLSQLGVSVGPKEHA